MGATNHGSSGWGTKTLVEELDYIPSPTETTADLGSEPFSLQASNNTSSQKILKDHPLTSLIK